MTLPSLSAATIASDRTEGTASPLEPLTSNEIVASPSNSLQCRTLVQGDVIGRVAPNFVLRLIVRSVVNVSFVLQILTMHFLDVPETRPASEFQLT